MTSRTTAPTPGAPPLALLAPLLLAACSGGAPPATGGPGVEEPGAEDPGAEGPGGGGSTPPGPVVVEPGPVVGRFELEQPAAETFLLRGTLPLPAGTWDGERDTVPLAVVDADGTPVASQVEVTSRYPSGAMGVDVAEILARVHRRPGVPAGGRVRYDVMLTDHPAPPATATDARVLHEVPDVEAAVAQLLADPGAVTVRSRDAFGHVYVHRPLESAHQSVRKVGRALAEVTTYGALLPEEPQGGAQAPLPHLLGVHAYLRTFAGEPVLGLDLRFHNGFDGRLAGDPTDDALGRVYFEAVELALPAGWEAVPSFEDPFLGAPYAEGEHTVLPLVRPLASGRLHVAPFQAQFHRRLVLAPSEHVGRARAIARGEGRAFCVRGTSPTSGADLWSWWLPATARYFPQSLLVPDLEHVGAESLRALMRARLEDLERHVADGTGTGSYPLVEGVLGWAHPWGISYGGMTGGDGIVFADGIETLCGASVEGYRYAELVHRMQTSRQPAALYGADGEPSSVEAWWELGGPYGGYVPFHCYLVENGSTDPFGLEQAPEHQVAHVEATDLAPPYEERLLEFQPHDLQHFVRFTRSPKVLAWLGNDELAADDLLAMAEAFHLSFHSGANGAGGGLQDSGLRALMERVAADPGVGSTLGRGEGWGLDCALAAYRTADPAWRAAKRPWFEDVIDTAALAQSQCTGFFQSIVNSHGLGGEYRVRQHIEHVILENALRGMALSVTRGEDPIRDQVLRSVLNFSYWGSVHPMAWTPGAGAPWSWTAVAPLDAPGDPWCQPFELPEGWHDENLEKYQLFTSLAAAYWTTGDDTFLERAREVLGVPDLLQGLMDDGLDNVGNRAALLAVVQRLHGIL